ncbi:MAG: recombinase family protein [Clostridia bacterium]
MKLATIYARYSSERQTEQSIEGQLDVCKKYAAQNGLQIIDTYIDRAMTGTNDNRVAFQQMLTDSAKAAWEIVLVYAIDRFGRNSIEMALNKQKLQKNGKILISATQRMSVNIDGTKNLDGILLENVLIGVAEYYSAELAQKIRRGLTESRKKGQFCGGTLPDGYCADKQLHIHINEDRAAVVRFVYEQYALGKKVPAIIAMLNERGILNSDGKPFINNGIYNILKNEKYAGIYRLKSGEVYENTYPRIVPQEIFDKVRAIVEQNKNGRRSVTTVYLLRFKVKCGYCGNPISADGGTARNGTHKHYYSCRGRKKLKNGCEKLSIRQEFLEELVLNTLHKKLSEEKTSSEMIARLMKTQARLMTETPVLNLLRMELKDVEKSLDNLVSALENGISSPTTNKRLNDLELRKEELSCKILVEQSKKATMLTESEIREYYTEMLQKEPQALVNELIKMITLYNDRMKIELNSPILKNPDESQGFSFYTEIVSIPTFYTCSPTPIMAKMTIELAV